MWLVAVPVFMSADSLASRDTWRSIYFGSCLLPLDFSPQRVYKTHINSSVMASVFSVLSKSTKKKEELIASNHLNPRHFLPVCTDR